MRRFLFVFVCCNIIAALSFAQDQVVTQTTVSGENTYVTHYLYDAQARPFLLLTDELSMQLYTYNELGQAVRQDYTDLTGSGSDKSYVYTYNDAGLCVEEEEFIGERSNGVTKYSYDAHGNRSSIITSNGLSIPWKNTYDGQEHLIKVEVMNPMGGETPLQTITYTYEGDFVVKEEHYSYGELSSITVFTYNDNGQLTKEVTSVPVVSEDETAEEEEEAEVELEVQSTTTYTYADIDVSLAPYNVTAVAGDGNTIVVTWEGAANSIVVDGKFYTVNGNSFTTPVLIDGTYTVYVINNGNATAAEPIDVVDNTKVGVSDVRLDGEITVTFEMEENRDGELVEVTYYHLPVAWTLPDGAKPIGYRIYYNSTYYVDVEDGSLRSYVIPAKNIKIYKMMQGEVVLPFIIRVIAIYDTGEMEPANELELDTEAILELAATVQAARAAYAKTEVYTLDGIRLPSRDNLRPGTYIFRQGKKARKVQTR